jgi:hypothetical protein
MGYYEHYTDNLNLRFWLTIFLVVSIVYLIKVAAELYLMEENPSILDKYALAKEAGVVDMDAFVGHAVSQAKIERPD